MRDELLLRRDERFQERAGQSCVPPTMHKVFDMLFLGGNFLFALQNVPLGLL